MATTKIKEQQQRLGLGAAEAPVTFDDGADTDTLSVPRLSIRVHKQGASKCTLHEPEEHSP